jgi:hypothetical protein
MSETARNRVGRTAKRSDRFRPFDRISTSYFAGTRTGAPLFLMISTRNFAGSVWLAFLETRCRSCGPS